MSQREDYEKKTEQILEPIAEKNGVKIYDVEYVKEGSEYYLRAYIDKDGGVNIGDCEAVSRELSDALDMNDFIEDAYIMEVSSPGLGRILKKDRHFENSIGEDVEIKLYKPVDGKKDFEGRLKAFDKETVTIVSGELGEEIDNAQKDDAIDGVTGNGTVNEQVFNRKEIAVIRLALDF